MKVVLILAFLFITGAMIGWMIELIFRRFFSSNNPDRKWINPGFCMGPYLPLYGFGLCTLFLLALLQNIPLSPVLFWNKALILLIMTVCMTVIEYIAGIFCLRVLKVRLWDYSECKGNIQGIICPKFTLLWAILSAIYYFLFHPLVVSALFWLEQNLAFSFLVGIFFGVFLVDVVYSSHLITKIKSYAVKNQVVVRYEALKVQVRQRQDALRQKHNFLFPLKTELSLPKFLEERHKLSEKQKYYLEKIRKKKDKK
ncbi:MAG: putative ABC transporter permease [Fastidiosipilaceae bacterium]|jgi:uncharacterized membrane protein